jgi:hypothetical protein
MVSVYVKNSRLIELDCGINALVFLAREKQVKWKMLHLSTHFATSLMIS